MLRRILDELGIQLDIEWRLLTDDENYTGIPKDVLEYATLLGQPPKSKIEATVKEEFSKKRVSSPDDIVDVAEYLGNSGIYIGYYANKFSDPTISRRNYDRQFDEFYNRTRIEASVIPGNTAVINWICVNPRFRNRDAGRDMYEAIEGIGRRLDVRKIELSIPVNSKDFWRKMGFIEKTPKIWTKELAVLRN